MTIRPGPGSRHPGYLQHRPRTSQICGQDADLQEAERRAFEHEHAKLYGALELAAQRAELAGHDVLAATLRSHRRSVSGEIARAECEITP